MTYFVLAGELDVEIDYVAEDERQEAIAYVMSEGEEVNTLDGVDEDMIVTDGQYIGYRDSF